MKDKITAEMMEQYEELRSLGPCNMLEYDCVMFVAGYLNLEALSDLGMDGYFYIMSNYDDLMKQFLMVRKENVEIKEIWQGFNMGFFAGQISGRIKASEEIFNREE